MILSKISSLTNNLKKSFSKAAARYDALSSFHQQYALRMVHEIVSTKVNYKSALDIGCGTGFLSGLLHKKFPQLKITGIDIAPGMIKQAKKEFPTIDFIEADANHLPFDSNSVDLVVSNFAYQWMPDLTKALSEVKRILNSQGQFKATLFGYGTCRELFFCLNQAGLNEMGEDFFVTKFQVEEALDNAGFSQFQVHEETGSVVFEDLWQLLEWLKAIGANKVPMKKFIGPRLLSQANDIALKQFARNDKLHITFSIIKIQANN